MFYLIFQLLVFSRMREISVICIPWSWRKFPCLQLYRKGKDKSYSGGVGMFQSLGRGQREVRNHLAGCALGVFIGGDEQDSTSWACCRISWMFGRLEETQVLSVCFLFI